MRANQQSNELVASVASTVRFSCGCRFETHDASQALQHVLTTKHTLSAHGMVGPVDRVRNIEPMPARTVRTDGWAV